MPTWLYACEISHALRGRWWRGMLVVVAVVWRRRGCSAGRSCVNEGWSPARLNACTVPRARGSTRARSRTRRVRVCVDDEDVRYAGRRPSTVRSKRGSTHAACRARVAQCVRDLSRVVGGLWGVEQTMVVVVPAVRQSQFLYCRRASRLSPNAPCPCVPTRARSRTRRVRVCVDDEDGGYAGRRPITARCNHGSVHTVCRACVARRVRDLSHVVGGLWGVAQTRVVVVPAVRQSQFLDIGRASRLSPNAPCPCVPTRARSRTRVGCVCVSTTRMVGMQAAGRSRSVATMEARTQSTVPMSPNACEMSHASWGVCGGWQKQVWSSCRRCANDSFLTAGVLHDCRPVRRARVCLRVRDLARVGCVCVLMTRLSGIQAAG